MPMYLLNVEAPVPTILPADSIKHLTQEFIHQVQTEPEIILRGWLEAGMDDSWCKAYAEAYFCTS